MRDVRSTSTPPNEQNESETRRASNCGFACFVRAEVGFAFTCSPKQTALPSLGDKLQVTARRRWMTNSTLSGRRRANGRATGERGLRRSHSAPVAVQSAAMLTSPSLTLKDLCFCGSFPWTNNNRCNITAIYSLFSNFLEY